MCEWKLQNQGQTLSYSKKSIHPSQLVKFYEDKMYKVNNQGQCETPSVHPSEYQDDMSTCSNLSAGLDNESNSCK